MVKTPILQGDILWADLNPTIGHEQSGRRPVLVMQHNTLNEHLNTIIVAPITSQLEFKGKMTTHFLSAKASGLKQDSVALLFHIRSLDKVRLVKKAGSISQEDFLDALTKLNRLFWH